MSDEDDTTLLIACNLWLRNKPKEYPNSNDKMGRFLQSGFVWLRHVNNPRNNSMAEDPKAIAVVPVARKPNPLPRLGSFMESLGISTDDVWSLFLLIDADDNGVIDLDEFVSGCMQLHGPAKSLQVTLENQKRRD